MGLDDLKSEADPKGWNIIVHQGHKIGGQVKGLIGTPLPSGKNDPIDLFIRFDYQWFVMINKMILDVLFTQEIPLEFFNKTTLVIND